MEIRVRRTSSTGSMADYEKALKPFSYDPILSTIQVDRVNELYLLIRDLGEDLVLDFQDGGKPSLEIYDDHRELTL